MTNHPFETPKPEHVWKHRYTGGGSTLAGPRKYREVAPKQAPTVPQKNLVCCGMLRHSAACCGMLQAVGGGNLIFENAWKLANRYIKHKTMHLLTPCNDGHNIIISYVVKLLLRLVTFPLFVHFIDIHDCQMVQCLIIHIETIVCWDVSQQTEGPLDMACRPRAADKKKIQQLTTK